MFLYQVSPRFCLILGLKDRPGAVTAQADQDQPTRRQINTDVVQDVSWRAYEPCERVCRAYSVAQAVEHKMVFCSRAWNLLIVLMP